jgi:hypothetical protein
MEDRSRQKSLVLNRVFRSHRARHSNAEYSRLQNTTFTGSSAWNDGNSENSAALIVPCKTPPNRLGIENLSIVMLILSNS